MNNMWNKTNEILPELNQKVYYFAKSLGIFLGKYDYQEYRYGGSEVFVNHHGVLGLDKVTHWMPYEHSFRNIIPLPPDYSIVDTPSNRPIINNEEVVIPKNQRTFNFTYSTTGGDIIYE